MKDKELRELLEEKGIIRTFVDGALVRAPFEGFDLQNHEALVVAVMKLKATVDTYTTTTMEQDMNIHSLTHKLEALEARFQALLVHQTLIIAKPVDEYTVTKL
jgi:hypothetical protein